MCKVFVMIFLSVSFSLISFECRSFEEELVSLAVGGFHSSRFYSVKV